MKKIVIEVLVDGVYCGGCQMMAFEDCDTWCSAFEEVLRCDYNHGCRTLRCDSCLCAKHYDANERVEPR